MHAQAYQFVADSRSHVTLTEADEVLEIGGQDMNGTVRGLFSPPARYLSLDITAGKGVDVVADAATWRPLDPDRLFAAVVCCEVFEHTPDWRRILKTCHDVLRPGGMLIATCAAPGRPRHSGVAPVPYLAPGEWYRNVSVEEIVGGLRQAGFDSGFHAGVEGQDLQVRARRTAAVNQAFL